MDCIDLHAHSTASDGSFSPTQLARHAKDLGLRAVALTDHDTAGGLEEFLTEAGRLGLEAVPGMETTMVVEDCDVHLICLYFDPGHPAIRDELLGLAASRREHNEAMVERLAEAGLDVSMEELRRYGNRAVSRGHIARLLIQKGHAANPKEAIVKYLSKGAVGYVRRRTPQPGPFMEAVHRAGGLCFVAHLHQIDPSNLGRCLSICRSLLEAGADGLETLYCEYDEHWRTVTEALAREYGALRSGGSDFHGSLKPGLELGVGYGNLAVPYSFLAAIKSRLGRP